MVKCENVVFDLSQRSPLSIFVFGFVIVFCRARLFPPKTTFSRDEKIPWRQENRNHVAL